MITAPQLRAARALLGIDQIELAERAQLSLLIHIKNALTREQQAKLKALRPELKAVPSAEPH